MSSEDHPETRTGLSPSLQTRPDLAMNADTPNKVAKTKRRIPLFGSWRNAYLAVVTIFILEVAFFYFVSRYFS